MLTGTSVLPAADLVVKIWSPVTGKLVRNLNGHTKGNSDVTWSSDSAYLASASDDTTIRIWNIDSVRGPRTPSDVLRLTFRNKQPEYHRG